MRSALIAVATLGAVWLLIQLWPIIVVVIVALMIVGALNPLVEALTRWKVGRTLAIALVFAALALTFAGFVAMIVPRLLAQVSDLIHELPRLQGEAGKRLSGTHFGAPLAHALAGAKWPELVLKLAGAGLAYSPLVAAGVGYCVVSLFLALYLLLERDRLRGGLFALLPRQYHVRTSRALLSLEVIVGSYVRGQIITSLMMAVFTFAVLAVLRVPSALALAAFAGLADVLPYVGALLACGPAVLAALSRSTSIALVVLCVLAAYQEFESRVIVPKLYGRVLKLPAAVIMVTLLIGGKLLGVVGALLALPIAAGIRAVIAELHVELPGEEAGDGQDSARDADSEQEFARRADGASPEHAAGIAMEIAAGQRLLASSKHAPSDESRRLAAKKKREKSRP